MLDLSSAFDIVDHKIVLTVLEQRFGVTGLALDWYLTSVTEHKLFKSDPTAQ